MFALALSHYSQNPESSSNVAYSFASLPLESIQYNYDLGDYDCSTLSLLPDIHTCCPGSNGSRVTICFMMYIKNFLTFGFPHCLFSQTILYSDMGVATDFLIWIKLCEVVDSSEVLKKKIHYEVVYHQCNVWVIIFLKQALNVFHGSFYFSVTSKDSVGYLSCG